MPDYPFEGQLVADPVTFQRATNGQIYVYDANDTTNSTPLALKDMTGLPLANPLTSSADAFTRPFYAPSQDIKLVGAGLTVFVSSPKGMRDAAAAAATAAQSAAANAAAAVESALSAAVADAEAAQAAATNAAALVAAPADNAIAAAINGAGTATKAALSATYAPRVSVDVLGYGAKGDGISDDHDAITAAITAAGVGGTVVFRKGKTFKTWALVPLDGQTWTGGGVLLRSAPTGAIINATGLDNFTLDGVIFDGNGGASTEGSGMVNLSAATNLTITRCTFRHSPNNVPSMTVGGVGATITDNYCHDVGYGINFAAGWGSAEISDAVIRGNRIARAALNGIFITDNIGSDATAIPAYKCKRVVIADNKIYDVGDCAIEVGFGSDVVTVSGNVIDKAAGVGIIIRNARNVAIAGNTVTRALGMGVNSVALNGAYQSCIRLNITGNNVSQCGTMDATHAEGNGYEIRGEDVTFTGNLASGNGGHGINLHTITRFTCSGNTSIGNGQDGISLGIYQQTSAEHGVISGNTCQDNAASPLVALARDGMAVHYQSRNLIFSGNNCSDTRATGKTQRYGLNAFSGAAAGAFTVAANRFTDNGTGPVNDNGSYIAP